jgi:hypothetical protein
MTSEHTCAEAMLQRIARQSVGGERCQAAPHIAGRNNAEIAPEPPARTTVISD